MHVKLCTLNWDLLLCMVCFVWRHGCVLGGLRVNHPAFILQRPSVAPALPRGRDRMAPFLVWPMLASCCLL
jgi:hypothetical protein